MPRPDLEQSITSLIASGDIRLAAEQLVTGYGSEVLGRCANLVGDRSLAEDLAQDVFGRAFTGLAGFRGESTIRTWLFTIVRNVCVDHHRRAAGSSWIRDVDADAEAQPDETPILIELMADQQQLRRALAALDETERALVVLRYVHGLGYPELAETFGIKEGATRMRLCRALERMRAELVPHEVMRAPRDRHEFEAPWSGAVAEPRSRKTPPRMRSISRERVPLSARPDFAASRGLEVASGNALSQDSLGQALGLILEESEARPPADGLVQGLRPMIARLAANDPPVRERSSWLRRLFRRG